LAEVLWGDQADRTDMLRLLVVIARGLRMKGLEGYEPPSEQIAAMYADDEITPDPEAGSEERRVQVMAFMASTGGG
jgi:hypothetical protein